MQWGSEQRTIRPLASDHLKAWEMCNEAMPVRPAASFLAPDHFKTEEMCSQAVEVDPLQLDNVLDYFKTQKIVWWCGVGKPFLFAICSRLVCDITTDRTMEWWRWLLWWWRAYWVVPKTQGTKSKNKRTFAHCLAPQSCDKLVHARRRELAVEVTDSCF